MVGGACYPSTRDMEMEESLLDSQSSLVGEFLINDLIPTTTVTIITTTKRQGVQRSQPSGYRVLPLALVREASV